MEISGNRRRSVCTEMRPRKSTDRDLPSQRTKARKMRRSALNASHRVSPAVRQTWNCAGIRSTAGAGCCRAGSAARETSRRWGRGPFTPTFAPPASSSASRSPRVGSRCCPLAHRSQTQPAMGCGRRIIGCHGTGSSTRPSAAEGPPPSSSSARHLPTKSSISKTTTNQARPLARWHGPGRRRPDRARLRGSRGSRARLTQRAPPEG